MISIIINDWIREIRNQDDSPQNLGGGIMDESLEPVQSNRSPADYYVRELYELEREAELEEIDRQMNRPPEEGKGQYIDVFA